MWSDRYVSPSAYAHFIEARVYQEAGDLRKALAHADLALSFDPESSYLRVFISELHLSLGNEEKSRRSLEKAFEIDAHSPHAFVMAGKLAEASESWEEVEEAAVEALRLDPDLLEAHHLLARTYLLRGKRVEAAAALATALKHHPEDVWSLATAGRLAYQERRLDEALGLTREHLRLRPRSSETYLRLSRILELKGQGLEAIALMDKCTRRVVRDQTGPCWTRWMRLLEPDAPAQVAAAAAAAVHADPRLAQEIADGLLEGGFVASLEFFVRGCYRLNPGLVELRFFVGVLRQDRGERKKAMEDFSMVPEVSLLYIDAQTRRAGLLIELGRVKDAQSVVKAALGVSPQTAQLHLLSAAIFERGGQERQALKVLEQALGRFPEHSTLRCELARASARQGLRNRAIKVLEEALENDPREACVLALLGGMLAHAREFVRAESLLRQAQSASKRPDVNVLSNLGWVLLKRGGYEEALTLLEQAATLAPKEPLVLSRYGDVLHTDGQLKQAIEAWRQAMALTSDRGLRLQLRRKIRSVSTPGE